MKKRVLSILFVAMSLQSAMAQSLEKMQWFNEPEEWEIEGRTLSMFVTP